MRLVAIVLAGLFSVGPAAGEFVHVQVEREIEESVRSPVQRTCLVEARQAFDTTECPRALTSPPGASATQVPLVGTLVLDVFYAPQYGLSDPAAIDADPSASPWRRINGENPHRQTAGLVGDAVYPVLPSDFRAFYGYWNDVVADGVLSYRGTWDRATTYADNEWARAQHVEIYTYLEPGSHPAPLA